jgi:hypothetical protein
VILVTEFDRLLLVALGTVGPVVGLRRRLNARDRLQTTLRGTMCSLTPAGLRDLTSIQVQCALLSGRSVVAVEMRKAMARLRAGLPLGARLLVNGSMDGGLATSFTIETVCTPVFAAETAPPADHGGLRAPIPAP